MNKQPRLVIFDLDGTLIDSVALIVETMEAVFTGLEMPIPDEETIRSVSGLNLEIALSIVAPHATAKDLPEIEKRYKHEFIQRVESQLREPLFPLALETLEELAGREEVLLAVATGKALRGAKRVLETHNIMHHFMSIQTPDHNRSKPDPEMIHSAMRDAGVSAQSTFMIGDTNHDMSMAKAAGVNGIGVKWGYHTPEALLAAGAKKLIESFENLIPTIDAMMDEASDA